MANKVFTKSDTFTSEYACSIVRIGEIKPIEGKDKIGYTLVNGESIVIRKDMVKEGDILIYASNETQLDKDFLSVNNLFEASSYELNSNANTVQPFVTKNKELKDKYEAIELHNIRISKSLNVITTYEAKLLAAENDEERESIKKSYENALTISYVHSGIKYNEGDNISAYIVELQKFLLNNKAESEKLLKEIENNSSVIKSNVGFFNKNGRVRAIKLGGILSMGYLFSIDELAKYNPIVKEVSIEDMVGEDFDTVDGKLFVKAYVPYVPERGTKGDGKSKDRKRNKKIEKFDRMVNGEFVFHYSTDPLPKCIKQIKPDDKVSISVKCHGTSAIFGKLHVKTPIKLPFHKWLVNKFIDITGLFKSKRITDYIIEYGNITSSRTVIKNQYINKNVDGGYYGVDVWSEYGNLIYPYLEEGMTVYGEIVGYLTGSDKMIQKFYDYGCAVGTNKFMPYRITTTNENGTKKEYNVTEVKEWTEKLINDHPEIADRFMVIKLLYNGTLADLYPDLSLTEHWHENVLEEMRNDKKHFGMEKNEPLCTGHKVYREGICLRKDDDEIKEAFKLKCEKFMAAERKAIDNGEVDIEMSDAYTN